jgi:dTDP-4-amino-4,6-dideoxy-D-galactose acyltransferase
MMAAAEPGRVLDWDSAFWGSPIGRVEGDVLTVERAAAIDGWARESSIACVCFLARADDPETLRSAQEAGFALVDVRLELARAVDQASEGEGVREARGDDVPLLRSIARASHEGTRFFADEHFPEERCRDFYETWISASCAGWADGVLVAEADGRAAGYVTCHVDAGGRTASIGLIGVVEGERQQGIGARLVSGALAWCADRDVTRLSVVTQGGNVPAQRLFQSLGFRTTSIGLWFHKWYGA